MSGSRISASTWYGPLNSRPKSPCSSPWSVVKTTSTSSSHPRAAIAREHAAERLVDQLALDRVAGVDLAHLVGGQRRRHPLRRRLVVRDERAVVPEPPVARLGVEDAPRARPPSRGSRRAAARRASRRGRPRTAAGPTGGAGRGSSSSRTSRRRRRASRARRSCGRPPSRCGTTRAAIGLTFTCGAPVSPPPAAFTCRSRVEHGVEPADRLGVLGLQPAGVVQRAHRRRGWRTRGARSRGACRRAASVPVRGERVLGEAQERVEVRLEVGLADERGAVAGVVQHRGDRRRVDRQRHAVHPHAVGASGAGR